MRSRDRAALLLTGFCAGAVPPSEDPPVELTKKNIQVLYGLPSSQLIPVMAVMANSLGVTCAHCHSAEWESDERPSKETARRMLRMTLATNRDFFDGKTVVTCNTCHRGTLLPVPVPRLVDAGRDQKPRASAPDVRGLPSFDEVLDRYISATGGLERITRLRARRSAGTVTRIRRVRISGRSRWWRCAGSAASPTEKR